MIEGAALAAILLDSRCRLRFFTPAAAPHLGLTPSDMGRSIGRRARDAFGPELPREFGRVMRTHQPARLELRTRAGSRVRVDVSPAPGATTGVVATFSSSHERTKEAPGHRQLLDEIARARDEAPDANQALLFALRRLCEHHRWRFGRVCLPAPDGSGDLVPSSLLYSPDADTLRLFLRLAARARIRRGQGLAARVAESGGADWADCTSPAIPGVKSVAAIPVRAGSETAAVIECFAETPAPGDAATLDLLDAVGRHLGHVFERRKLQENFVEAIWRRQRELGQTLHDSVGQDLTGLGLLGQSLTEKLKSTGQPGAFAAEQLTSGIQRVLANVRALCRGLQPAPVDSAGLRSALEELAGSVRTTYGIPCRFEGPDGAATSSDQVATQLFRIAQEAITNAARHAQARDIRVLLRRSRGKTTLEVRDDGKGITGPTAGGGGMGLKIMRHRASGIGASLTVARARDGGTVVRCVVPGRRKP